MKEKYFEISEKLILTANASIKLGNQTEIDRTMEFFDWKSTHIDIFNSENNPVCIHHGMMIDNYSINFVNFLPPSEILLIQKYYKLDLVANKYILNKSIPIENYDRTRILNKLLLRPGNVIWCEFGYNVGSEFRGKHPALIIGRSGDCVYVLPITSTPAVSGNTTQKSIAKIYGRGYALRARRVDFDRFVRISTKRIDKSSNVGRIEYTDFKIILSELKLFISKTI